MIITMSNNEIYQIFTNLMEQFNNGEQKFPVKINFYLQKNKNTLMGFAQEIETARLGIINNYGSPSEDNPGQYIIPPENIEIAQQELDELFALEQDVQLYKTKIDDFPADMSLTASQMEALLFMIED